MKSLKIFFSNYWKTIVNVIMVIYCAKMLYLISLDLLFDLRDINRFYPSEFLINYQGGFVRRGLLGEMIFLLCKLTGWHPMLFTAIICILCFVALSLFFLWQFKKNNLSWWIIPLSIMLGFFNIIHKDALMLLCFIADIYVLKGKLNDTLKIILINLITISAILIHESFFFICIPLLCVIIYQSDRLSFGKLIRLASIIPILLSFAVVCVYHGNTETANSILASWSDYYYGLTLENIQQNAEYNVPGTSLGALSWSVDVAFQMHFSINFLHKSIGIPGYITRPLLLLLIYYFTTNYNFFFTSKVPVAKGKQAFFPKILLFQFFSLLPLFTVLSCDTIRICCYWLSSTYIVYLLLDPDELKWLFPKQYIFLVDRFQSLINKIRPSMPLMVFLLLFIGVPKVGSDITNAFFNSPIMGLHWLLMIPYHLLF